MTIVDADQNKVDEAFETLKNFLKDSGTDEDGTDIESWNVQPFGKGLMFESRDDVEGLSYLVNGSDVTLVSGSDEAEGEPAADCMMTSVQLSKWLEENGWRSGTPGVAGSMWALGDSDPVGVMDGLKSDMPEWNATVDRIAVISGCSRDDIERSITDRAAHDLDNRSEVPTELVSSETDENFENGPSDQHNDINPSVPTAVQETEVQEDSGTPDPPENEVSTDVENDGEGAAGQGPSYFDDDEQMLSGDDVVIDEDLDMGVVKQSGPVVSWVIENFYKDNGQPRSKGSLRNDPPILTVGNSDGDSVSIVVTREFAGQFESIMGDVYRAYYGISSKRSREIGRTGEVRNFDRFKKWTSENKVKAVIGGLVILILVCSAVFF